MSVPSTPVYQPGDVLELRAFTLAPQPPSGFNSLIARAELYLGSDGPRRSVVVVRITSGAADLFSYISDRSTYWMQTIDTAETFGALEDWVINNVVAFHREAQV